MNTTYFIKKVPKLEKKNFKKNKKMVKLYAIT